MDVTYSRGRVGLREDTGESASFSNVKVTAPDGTVLFSDDFSKGMSQWEGVTRPRGIPISDDSCGGQPDDVAVLPSPDGRVYLFQSDRWNNGDQNEALATRYWEPLRFAADGSIEPLRCGLSYQLALAGLRQSSDEPPADLDQTSGTAGFHAFCDVRDAVTRMQTFVAGHSGTLSRVGVTVFQDDHVDAPLTLSIAPVAADGRPGATAWSTTVPAASVAWSPTEVVRDPGLPVVAGHRYAVQIAAPDATRGCYGFAYNDADPYAAGAESISTDGGHAWTEETSRDLKFETSVS
jgi:hypothetical protein